eukprot:Lithocolla_globosa_v1_NODE_5724_length_1196_cov_2.537248.p2 type:complete len:192 gc:universal NODE_5724_length_1196_cov_2.537248:577-1152(+)
MRDVCGHVISSIWTPMTIKDSKNIHSRRKRRRAILISVWKGEHFIFHLRPRTLIFKTSNAIRTDILLNVRWRRVKINHHLLHDSGQVCENRFFHFRRLVKDLLVENPLGCDSLLQGRSFKVLNDAREGPAHHNSRAEVGLETFFIHARIVEIAANQRHDTAIQLVSQKAVVCGHLVHLDGVIRFGLKTPHR